jgi:rhodanese-related sulfurtransferase
MIQFLADNWHLFLVAITSGGMLLWGSMRKGGGGGRIGTAEAVTLINREKAVLIDVSEPAEFGAGHPVGAKNVPIGSLEKSGDLPKNKALPLVVVCPTGGRASRAVPVLKKLGFDKVHVLAGGLASWREANLPVEKTS